jgi:hypothetical protein
MSMADAWLQSGETCSSVDLPVQHLLTFASHGLLVIPISLVVQTPPTALHVSHLQLEARVRSAQLELASAAGAAESALAEVQAGGEARAEGLRQELVASNSRRAELEARLQVGQAGCRAGQGQLLPSLQPVSKTGCSML